jgi:signal transduction histidine kinase
VSAGRWRWSVFALSALGALAGLGVASRLVLDWERFEVESQRYDEHHWQLDRTALTLESALAPVLTAESTRPEHHYQALYAADDVVSPEGLPIGGVGVAIPSPLLQRHEPLFRLHFEWSAAAGFGSPQVPPPRLAALAVERGWTTPARLAAAEQALAALSRSALDHHLAEFRSPLHPHVQPAPLIPAVLPLEGDGADPGLFLLRRVGEGAERVQGVWVDWPTLRRRLLSIQPGLARDARLVPSGDLGGGPREPRGVRLTLLPIEIQLAAAAPPPPAWSATRTLLGVAWASLVAALLAIGVALAAALRLSDKRGRFASAVTHELRTPLTTFCLYSEMLAGGMVRDEAARQEYLDTLVRESQRLRRVVDNVLLYARVEQQRSQIRAEPQALKGLLQALLPSLEQRAAGAGLRLEVQDPRALDPQLTVAADAQVVEQVLANLIDNAAKYARSGPEPTARLSCAVGHRRVRLVLSDDGPGIAASQERRLFQAFERLGDRGDRRQPGIGLGLALSRGLARELGGELRLVRDGRPRGATFELELRRVRGPRRAPQ